MIDMEKFYSKIRARWKTPGLKQYYWGDDLDLRYYLCKLLSQIKNKRILEVGCGTGIITSFLDKTNDVTCVDPDEKSIKQAKKNVSHAKFVKNLFQDFQTKAKFDILLFSNILYAIPINDRQNVINKAKNLLKKNGKIILTTVNGDSPYFSRRKKHKFSKPTSKELENYFKGTNFEIKPWNPFYIRLGKILRHIPGIFKILEYMMNKKINYKGSCSYLVIAKK